MNFFRFNTKNERTLGLTLAFGALLWTGTYNALAKGLTPFLSPITLIILSEALTAVFIVLTFGVVPLLKELWKMDARSIRMAAFLGLLNSAIVPLLWFNGLARTSAINASMLSAGDILCILVLGSFVLGERISRMQMLGGFVVFLGVLVINFSSSSGAFSIHLGDALVFSGALLSGAGSVLFKKYLSHVMPELAILIRNLSGIVAVSILALFIRHSFVSEVQAFPMQQVLLLVAFTFFSRYLNLTFYYEALDRLPATTMSLIQIGSPLSGMLFAFLILGEQIHSYQVLGGIFIVFGLMLEQVSERTLLHLRRRSVMAQFHNPFHSRTITEVSPISMTPKQV